MLYQLSYLGPWPASYSPLSPLHQTQKQSSPRTSRPHAASGDEGGSSSNSDGGTGIRYCSPSQRPRSTSAHRGEQKGRFRADGARPQIGHRGGILAIQGLKAPAVVGKRRVRSRIQTPTGDPRKV